MAHFTEYFGKSYPQDMCKVEELPDEAPPEYPAPWKPEDAGNDHVYLYDANGKCVAHLYIWKEDEELLEAKLKSINSKNPS
jgi:hypothetical protein